MAGYGFSRREFSARMGAAAAGMGITGAWAADISPGLAGEISRSNAAIHQQVIFAQRAARVYAALTVSEQFDRVAASGDAMNSRMKTALGSAPTHIDARPGGAFSLFGGYVTGFNLEIVPNMRLVQAWRAGSWAPGIYSIARFVLSEEGAATRLVFDHTGFPNEAADHLAMGWHDNYWKPMARVL